MAPSGGRLGAKAPSSQSRRFMRKPLCPYYNDVLDAVQPRVEAKFHAQFTPAVCHLHHPGVCGHIMTNRRRISTTRGRSSSAWPPTCPPTSPTTSPSDVVSLLQYECDNYGINTAPPRSSLPSSSGGWRTSARWRTTRSTTWTSRSTPPPGSRPRAVWRDARGSAHTSVHHTKPAPPRVAVSALRRAHSQPQSSVARHPAPRAPAGPRHGHAGRGLHHGVHGVRDEDQRLPRQLQDRDEVDQGLLGDSLLNLI